MRSPVKDHRYQAFNNTNNVSPRLLPDEGGPGVWLCGRGGWAPVDGIGRLGLQHAARTAARKAKRLQH